ncbi:hypothetical protein CLOM_g4606 [Closterium sp. NIES-68]|nr:hypothetical protein CLOM_g4606 [Closterium sp. NIES-68]GJP72759.1 hypothetical protein CLOP_g3507 [Closterium sp. NIES-67]
MAQVGSGGSGADVEGWVGRCAFLAVEGREDCAHAGERWSAGTRGAAEEEAGRGRKNTVEVVAALALVTRLCGGSERPAAQWQQQLERLLPLHAFHPPRRVVVVVPTREQQQAAERAWSRLQRQQGRQQVAATGAGGAVEVRVVVAGLPSLLPTDLASCDLALITAVCAPPSQPTSGDVHSLWPPTRPRGGSGRGRSSCDQS